MMVYIETDRHYGHVLLLQNDFFDFILLFYSGSIKIYYIYIYIHKIV